MKKIRGAISKIEDKMAIIKSNGQELLIPTDFIELGVGESIVITLTSEKEDSKNAQEVAEALLKKALLEE
ncbi:MAG: hypothetical protein PHT36_00985 [Patescibacteria group bacterium]|nr:hypothetical protein [Patescibacteria group bacterium]